MILSYPRSHWTRQFFGPLYGYLYRKYLLPGERTRREVRFAKQVCRLHGKRVLDLAAGFGRHARLLARSNEVWALDQNRTYLQMAREGLALRTLANLRLVQGDMRALPYRSGVFDAVLVLFNSFGYFISVPPPERERRQRELWRLPAVFYERGLVPDDYGVWRESGTSTGSRDSRLGSPEKSYKVAADSLASPTSQPNKDENIGVLMEIARVLSPGGDFLLEAPNPRPLLAAIAQTPRRWMVTRDFEIEEEFSYDREQAILSNVTRFSVPGRTEWANYHLRLYSRRELVVALRECGFRVCAVFGSYEGERFQAASSPMILIHARKRT